MPQTPRPGRRLAAVVAASALPVLLLGPAAQATAPSISPQARTLPTTTSSPTTTKVTARMTTTSTSTKPKKAGTVPVRVISFNDLHGNLQPPAGSSGRVYLANGKTVDAGGVAYLATHAKQLARGHHAVLLSSGDNIGASPLASALFHDEPTIEALNAMGVRASVVGNHEFDEGLAELRRIEYGGCQVPDGCQFRTSYAGADFPFLGANVTFDTGKPAFAPYSIQKVGGVKVGVIGVTLKGLPDVVTPTAISGLEFTDEVAAINRSSRLLQRKGVKAQVVLMHQGDETTNATANSCSLTPGEAAPARTIATTVTSRVDAVFAAHTHQAENCTVTDPAGHARPLIQGLSFGRLLSVVDLRVNTRTHDVVRSATVARNVVVTRTVTPDAKVQAIVDRAVTEAAPLANRQVGSLAAPLLRGDAPEQPLGDVIADAQLAATTGNGAQVAITNPGGIRADLSKAGPVSYGDAFAVQPFANIMQTITLTGADLKKVLEQQAQAGKPVTWLQVSSTLHYTWTTGAVDGSHVSDLTVAGKAVDPAASYRVSVNNFLAAGGDGFAAFTAGTNLTGGPIDLDAFTAYLKAHPDLAPPAQDRITVVG